jgi:hypothetical protein
MGLRYASSLPMAKGGRPMTRAFFVLTALVVIPSLTRAQTVDGTPSDAQPPAPTFVDFADNLRVVTGDTPSLRLEQNSSGGQTPYAWDLQTSYSGYFALRDVTGGNRYPISVAPSSGSGTISIAPAGLGIGIAPTARLHVFSDDAGTSLPRVLVEESSTISASRNMLRIVNRGASTFRFDNSTTGAFWGFGSLGNGNFFVGSSAGQPLAFTLTPAGNVTLTGTLVQMSDRNAKHDIVPVDPEQVLARVSDLPLSVWSYNGDSARHIGPMAQDFASAFRFGDDDKHLAPADLASVGLAAVQALNRRLTEQELRSEQKDAQLRELRERLEALEARLRDARP